LSNQRGADGFAVADYQAAVGLVRERQLSYTGYNEGIDDACNHSECRQANHGLSQNTHHNYLASII
jgi:hypothetical protein